MANFTFFIKIGTAALLLLCVATAGHGQGNPFDLQPRIEAEASPDSAAATPISTNPFDKVRTPPPSGQRQKVGMWIPESKKAKPISAKEKETQYRRFLFICILTMFIALTLIVTIFRILIEKVWKGFINDNLLNQLHREQSSGLAVAYFVLYLLFFLNGGLFAFLAAKHFGITISSSNIYALLICVGGLAGFFLAKHLVLWLIGVVFPAGKEIASYQFTITVFNIVAGLFLVPIILFISYAPKGAAELVLYGAFGLLALTYLFLSLRGLFIGNRFIATNKFHFLLYLCVVEIAPLLIIFKMMAAPWGN